MSPASTSSPSKALQRELRAQLEAAARPEAAPIMQRYMKSAMPYYGVSSVPLRAICKQVFARHPLDDYESFRDTVLALYRGARMREERYAAIELLGLRLHKPHRTLQILPLLEELIVTGAWWDLVDPLATHRLGELLAAHPKRMKPAMLRWAEDDDIWKRRSAILCQNRFKGETDLDLLYACIEPSLERKEFFLRKAIGWALREYAWTDPKAVQKYVRANEARLSGLSRREALKNVGARGGREA
jgi:3-methyladenine DNA glycosylase AlkD